MRDENDDGAGGPTAPDANTNSVSNPVHRAHRRRSDRSHLARRGPTSDLVRNVWLPPDERRVGDAWAVIECPFCLGAHLHRGKAGKRRAPCGRGWYSVGPWAT